MEWKRVVCFWLVIVLTPVTASAGHLHPERWYQKKWCSENQGQTEVRLPDGTRCDCLTDTYAIEFDFGPKWAEAIGQALYYGLQTGKKAGVVLILEQQSDYRYQMRLDSTVQYFNLPIKTWRLGP